MHSWSIWGGVEDRHYRKRIFHRLKLLRVFGADDAFAPAANTVYWLVVASGAMEWLEDEDLCEFVGKEAGQERKEAGAVGVDQDRARADFFGDDGTGTSVAGG